MSLPNFPQFNVSDCESSCAPRWKKYIAKLNNLMTALDVSNNDRKKALLLHCGGDEIVDIVGTFPEDKKSSFDVLSETLMQHFAPKVNITFESYKFRQMMQHHSESMDQFHIRLSD